MKKLVFIVIVIIAVLALVILPGCKKAGDITGTWYITTVLEGNTFSDQYDFVGNKNSGEVLWNGQSLGSYSVFGNNVNFTLQYLDPDDDFTVEVYEGSYNGEDFMNGTFTYTVEGYATLSGTWYGDR